MARMGRRDRHAARNREVRVWSAVGSACRRALLDGTHMKSTFESDLASRTPSCSVARGWARRCAASAQRSRLSARGQSLDPPNPQMSIQAPLRRERNSVPPIPQAPGERRCCMILHCEHCIRTNVHRLETPCPFCKASCRIVRQSSCRPKQARGFFSTLRASPEFRNVEQNFFVGRRRLAAWQVWHRQLR